METIIFLIILFTLTFLKLLIQGLYLIHRLQQLGYYNLKFIEWLQGSQYRELLLWNIFELLFPLFIIFTLLKINELTLYKYLTSFIMILTFIWKIIHPFFKKWITFKAKVPLVFTARIKRLFITFIFVITFVLIFVFLFATTPFYEFNLQTRNFFKLNAFILFLSVITPIFILSANLINLPLEKLIHFIYFTRAKNKVKRSHSTNIAITGSYGKTSTKFFLSTILSEKYKTLNTPGSFNTLMGISKIVNSNHLNKYKYFIVEMGADRKGDINKLCKLVKPDYGIITSIDIQHLETFITIENIINTKLSLFLNLSKKGFGIYNYDSELLRDNIKKIKTNQKLYSYSMEEMNKNEVDIYAVNIKHTRDGLDFVAYFKNKNYINIKANLLGRHNVSNLLPCILLAKNLGLSNEEIKKGIGKILPVEHRLQKIESSSGILVLDDAFNANLKGAYEALRVLNEISGKKKIIVTPGLIGLGEKEKEINKIFGNYIADFSTIAILIGKKRTKSIYEGIIEKNFNKKNIIIVNSLNESKNILKNIVEKDDIILFENDLPDAFNE
ncbi:MAG: UDP-N-acetylmuramoyl-tripeptide--D-alanyl-D-alanine ligase [Spirochaetes bacterium]|nr:UDP-N-acetylmuramoyl-tripeptide--D-alanyl-D-alanine ligase [Spirochaetota bacterium]